MLKSVIHHLMTKLKIWHNYGNYNNVSTIDMYTLTCNPSYLNESSSLHALRQRYGHNLVHTWAGPSLLTINPCSPLSIYGEKVAQMFGSWALEDLPPHIYSGEIMITLYAR